MSIRISLILIVAICLNFQQGITAETDESRFLNWLMDEARRTDFEQIKAHTATYYLLKMAESCHDIKQEKLAQELLKRAEIIAKDKNSGYNSRLFQHAVQIGRLDIAERYANAAGPLKDGLLDRLDVERYRRGDKKAIQNYPRQELDFYNAMYLAEACIDVGDFKLAEEFTTDIVISEENDPRAVTGLTLKGIALKCREQGDMENAKLYIDKALATGGNLFYTGYTIKITHRSIHGTLNKDLERFAKLGQAHRGHMARELVQSLLRELTTTELYDEAKKTVPFLEDSADQLNYMVYIASEQAKNGHFTAAFATVDEIDDASARGLARLGIATAYAQAGKGDTAKKLADIVLRSTEEKSAKDADKQLSALAGVYGMLGSQAELEKVFSRSTDPNQSSVWISAAVSGFANNARIKK